MSNEEKWKPVVGFEAAYEVSDHGRVRRVLAAQGTQAGHILKPMPNAHGYWNYNIQSDGKRIKLRAHRLVLDAFVGPQPEMFGLHFDDDPSNNRLENLRWGSRLDNAADWKRNGIRIFPNQNAVKTHCKRGHEFTDANTQTGVTATGARRRCRTCKRADNNARRKSTSTA